MEGLVSEIELSHSQVKRCQGRLMSKIDELIAEATKAKDQIDLKVASSDTKAVNQHLVQYVKRGQHNFKKVVNTNKD